MCRTQNTVGGDFLIAFWYIGRWKIHVFLAFFLLDHKKSSKLLKLITKRNIDSPTTLKKNHNMIPLIINGFLNVEKLFLFGYKQIIVYTRD